MPISRESLREESSMKRRAAAIRTLEDDEHRCGEDSGSLLYFQETHARAATHTTSSMTIPATSAWLALLTRFVPWYVATVPHRIVRDGVANLRALHESFSIVFLLRTLVQPWKHITDPYPSKGINVTEILATLSMNLVSRGVGAVIRLITIVISLAIECAAIVAVLSFLAFWIALPVLAIAGVIALFFFLT